MDPDSGIFIILIMILLFTFIAIVGGINARKRREGLQGLAASLGFQFSQARDYRLASELQFLRRLNQGDDQYAYNILRGEYKGYPVMVFDYHYSDTDADGDTDHYYFSFFTLKLSKNFPELVLRREGVINRLGQALGFDDIDFESVEFSNKYVVRSKDKKFAYDFCNARMISYLLDGDVLNIEVDRDILSLGYSRCLEPGVIVSQLDILVTLRSLMPNYLFES